MKNYINMAREMVNSYFKGGDDKLNYWEILNFAYDLFEKFNFKFTNNEIVRVSTKADLICLITEKLRKRSL